VRALRTRSTTQTIRDPVDHIEAALEAVCGVLIALESLHGLAGDARAGSLPSKRLSGQATTSLREAIGYLRAAAGEAPNMFAFGFIVSDRARGR
jgi:hypothetical protein